MGLVGLGCGSTRSPLLDVDHVDVRGASHTSTAAVAAAAGVGPGIPMTAVHPDSVARRLGRLPWIREATVSRRWPGTVVITVRERSAVAVLRDGHDAWALIDGTGRVLDRASPGAQGLPVLEGLPPAGVVGTSLPTSSSGAVRVAAALPQNLRPWVGAVVGLDGNAVELHLRPEGVVRLGDPSRLSEKIQALVTVLQQVDVHDLGVVDLRDPAGPLLTRTRGRG